MACYLDGMSRPIVITTTMSFRSAEMYGCPHLAGQPVRLTRRPAGFYDVVAVATGEPIGRAWQPCGVRNPGGVLRSAEMHYPGRFKPRRGHHLDRWRDELNAWRKSNGVAPL